MVLQKFHWVAIDYFGARPHSYLTKNEIPYSESDIGVGVGQGGRGGEGEVRHERGCPF